MNALYEGQVATLIPNPFRMYLVMAGKDAINSRSANHTKKLEILNEVIARIKFANPELFRQDAVALQD